MSLDIDTSRHRKQYFRFHQGCMWHATKNNKIKMSSLVRQTCTECYRRAQYQPQIRSVNEWMVDWLQKYIFFGIQSKILFTIISWNMDDAKKITLQTSWKKIGPLPMSANRSQSLENSFLCLNLKYPTNESNEMYITR